MNRRFASTVVAGLALAGVLAPTAAANAHESHSKPARVAVAHVNQKSKALVNATERAEKLRAYSDRLAAQLATVDLATLKQTMIDAKVAYDAAVEAAKPALAQVETAEQALEDAKLALEANPEDATLQQAVTDAEAAVKAAEDAAQPYQKAVDDAEDAYVTAKKAYRAGLNLSKRAYTADKIADKAEALVTRLAARR